MNSSLLLSPARRASAPKALRPATSLRSVKPTDIAIHVMTDFAHEHPITVNEQRRIDDALEDMICFGVRALLVVRGDKVTGLITSYDIQGERPLQFLQSSTYTRHDQIQVGHVMTALERVPALDWEEIRDATVADISEIFAGTPATHLIVLESGVDGSVLVRGLISRTRLLRQLA
jgi:hypothetical protein